MVSYYFHKTRRQKGAYGRALSDFIRDPLWGMDRLEEFMDKWYQHRHIPKDLMVLRYEDLHVNSQRELRRILNFLNLDKVSDEIIYSAVEHSTFDNLRSMSVGELRKVHTIAPTDPEDPQTFKIREGKVGGYVDYLSAADVAYIEEKMHRELWAYFGYKVS
jgi:hypothetical protein